MTNDNLTTTASQSDWPNTEDWTVLPYVMSVTGVLLDLPTIIDSGPKGSLVVQDTGEAWRAPHFQAPLLQLQIDLIQLPEDLSKNKAFVAGLTRGIEDYVAGRVTPWEDVKRDLGIKTS